MRSESKGPSTMHENESQQPVEPIHVVVSQRSRASGSVNDSPPHAELMQLLGLDVRAAVLTFVVDLLIFGSDTLSFELMIPLGIAAAAVLGLIVYRIQRKWYGDDHESALIKALVVGLLTAIPVPITSVLSIPAGCIGVLSRLRRK